MSILKSILHHYNQTTKSYDTLHPETEVAQITDFADGIVSKLAATTAISAISALQTDSWFGKMMKWVLDASGVKYLIDTNGYVCFGSLFGGLIIQWRTYKINKGTTVSMPITATHQVAWACDTGSGCNRVGVSISGRTLLCYAKSYPDNYYDTAAFIIAVGR